ncbi:hypothetical protein K431DRAFT_238308 [Polychaeton citri CBS 116435]|uniref:FAD-binding FR-type domain-containing protein n=1 Tax=Polychaeton citri CBS 116435 TaxID=1314669 RepID=A0A9P4QJB7_9PEZI|nr:hypothetical protein K431DRAFT_238308 [Polychaeton citri CBS 116435]
MRGLYVVLSTFGAIFSQSALAAKETRPLTYCVEGCSTSMRDLIFNGSSEEAQAGPCVNQLAATSLLYCAAIYCSPQESKAGLMELNGTCTSYYSSTLPSFESALADLGAGGLNDVQRVSLSSTDLKSTTFDHAVVPDLSSYRLGHNTVGAFYNNWWLSDDLKYSLYGFWCLVFLIGASNHILHFTRSSTGSKSFSSSGIISRIRTWIRRCLILPALFGGRCQEPVGWCTIPPRIESMLLGIYIALNFVYLFPGYQLFSGNLYYAAQGTQLARYLSDRTGMLAIGNLPILWLFATRNNPLLWATGWSFAAYTRLHRWVARITTFEIIIHAVGYSVLESRRGRYKEAWAEQYWYCGVIALIMMSFLLISSVYIIRKKFYDLFLTLHVIFATTCLVTVYFHVKIFDNEFKPYVWASVAFWSFDRLLRIIRTVFNGVLPRMKGVKALAMYNRKTGLIRLDVTDFFPYRRPSPGTYYYIYEPGNIRGYESHPFTTCSWTDRSISEAISPALSVTNEFDEKKGDLSAAVRSATSGSEENSETRHTFLIKPHAGFTSRLQNKLSAMPENDTCEVTILLEGAYGTLLDLRRFSNVLIIAGGTGVAAAISHTYFLLSGPNSTSIRTVWAVRDNKLVDDVCRQELRDACASHNFSLEVYLTSQKSEADTPSPSFPSLTFKPGRPDVLGVITKARAQSTSSLAVICCGSDKITDACRKAVVNALCEPGNDVEFFNESMVW